MSDSTKANYEAVRVSPALAAVAFVAGFSAAQTAGKAFYDCHYTPATSSSASVCAPGVCKLDVHDITSTPWQQDNS